MTNDKSMNSDSPQAPPPRMTVFKDEVHWGPGSDPLAFPDTIEYLSEQEHTSLLQLERAKAFEEAAKECDDWLDLLEKDHRAKLDDKAYPDPQEGGREYRNHCNLISAVRAAIRVKANSARAAAGEKG